MKILLDSAFEHVPEIATIFLDTNELIFALESPEFNKKVFGLLKYQGCSLVTSPEVFWEFVRSSSTVQNYNKRKAFIESLVDNFPPIKKRMENEVILYMLALHKECPHMDYADLLLGVALCTFPSSYLLTQNHDDFPLSVFDRVGIVTVDNGKKIHNHGLYTIKRERLAKVIESLK